MLPNNLFSLQHPFVKYLVALRTDRLFRREEGKVVVLGKKLIDDLQKSNTPPIAIFYDEKNPPPISYSCPLIPASSAVIKKITAVQNPEPIAALVVIPPWKTVQSAQHLLVLDGISDPGNLGTLLRSAVCFGWDGVFLTENTCDPFNDKAVRSAKGATFHIPLQEGKWEEFLSISPLFHVFVADMDGEPLTQIEQSPPIALILSRESSGPRDDAKERFPSISIPISSKMESLNVAAAGAILLHRLTNR